MASRDAATRFSKGSGVTSRDYPLKEPTLLGVLFQFVCRFVAWLSFSKLIAVAVWGVGVYCTAQATALFFTTNETARYASAVLLQAGLTGLQSPIWRPWAHTRGGKRRSLFWPTVCVGIDALLNITGTEKLIAKAHELPFVPSVIRLLDPSVTGEIAPLTGLPALALAALLAGLLSAAPELLWFRDE